MRFACSIERFSSIFSLFFLQFFNSKESKQKRSYLFTLFHFINCLFLGANIRKTLSEFHIQVNICLQIFAYQQILAHIASNFLEILLQVLGLN
jgi:hypothetical protein